MSDFLADAAEWLNDTMAEQVGQSITYKRGATTIPIAGVTIGRTAYRANEKDNGRSLLIRSDADFVFAAALLDLGSGQVEPLRGDVITWNGTSYEAMPINGEPCFRKSDQYGVRIRVHTMEKLS